MDYLEFANPKSRFTASALYFEHEVDDPTDGGQRFTYEYLDPLSHTYRKLFGNIQSTDGNGELAIRTGTRLPYKQGAYIKTQDGKFFQIIQMQEDFSAAKKQAMRILPIPVSVQYVIRMVQIEDPWEIV